MNNKILSFLFLVLMIGGIFFSFYLYFELKKSNEALEVANTTLEQTKAELLFEKRNNNNQQQNIKIQSLRDTPTLPSKPIIAKPTNGVAGNTSKKEEDIKKQLENAQFFIGIFALNDSLKLDKATHYLDNKGYTIITSIDLTSKPSWFSSKSTVFYYAPSTKELATKLASEIGKITNTRFKVEQGAGLGVPSDKRELYFYVHLVE